MANAAQTSSSGRRFLLPVNDSAQCEAAFSYLLTTAGPNDIINLIHVALIPDPEDYESEEGMPSLYTLRMQGQELCATYRRRAGAAGLESAIWNVFGESVVEEIIEWSDVIGTDWIVIGANPGTCGQRIMHGIGLELMLQSDKPVLVVPS